MEGNMYEDMFTPEGIPMTSPHDCGMPGYQGWKYDMWHIRSAQDSKKKEIPAMAYTANND